MTLTEVSLGVKHFGTPFIKPYFIKRESEAPRATGTRSRSEGLESIVTSDMACLGTNRPSNITPGTRDKQTKAWRLEPAALGVTLPRMGQGRDFLRVQSQSWPNLTPAPTSPLAALVPASQWPGTVPPEAGHSTEASLEEECTEAQG